MNQAGTPAAASGLSFNRAEASGALGDLGTFIPLLAGMVHQCGLQLGPALFCAGFMNVVTGLAFRIPMPVQPMKAIAAVAIGEGLTQSQIICAGLATSAVILLLGASRLIDWFSRAIPRSVVRGIQLALGLKLLSSGYVMIADTAQWFGWDSIAMGISCALIVLACYFSTRIPAALLIFIIGLLALIAARPEVLAELEAGMSWSLPVLNRAADWRSGILKGAVPQIPLTLLNSVIAVCALSGDLFPHRAAAPRRVATSVALMNLISCPLGGMPMCHGAGGLAAQYRFGARTGGSVVILGVAKMVLAILCGGSLLKLLLGYPESVLGVLLLFSGLELSLVCRDQTRKTDFFVMMLTAGACLALNTAAGFVIGWVMAALLLWGVFRVEAAPNGQ